MHGRDVRAFYDGLAADYHLIFGLHQPTVIARAP